MRYTFHGGGPCDGALNGAVMPDPLSSGSVGQPLSAHAFAIRASAPGSVTRAASPSITTSASRIDTAIEHRGSRATLRPFRVPAPVWNQNVPSSHRAPTAVTCGLPSSLMVDSQVVREFTASGAGADPASSFSATAAQSTAPGTCSPTPSTQSRNPLPRRGHGETGPEGSPGPGELADQPEPAVPRSSNWLSSPGPPAARSWPPAPTGRPTSG